MRLSCRALVCFLAACRVDCAAAKEGASEPAYLPEVRFHLTARPWAPVDAPVSELVDRLDTAMHALAPLQYWNDNDPKDVKNGAIIDPYNKAEVQYSTPLFAFNVATLLSQGRGADLATAGIRALDRATLNISTGPANDYHGEFFCAPMVKALRIYESLQDKYPEITAEKISTWRKRLTTKRTIFMNMKVKQNWRTFAMKGEWLRQQEGLITDGVKWIEGNWTIDDEGHQRERFWRDRDQYKLDPYFFLYHDETAKPETFAYNGATTSNLLDMLENGYDGPSAAEMRKTIEHSLQSSLLLMSGSGEAAAGGRTGEHIWDDTVYAVGFEMMAEIANRNGDLRRAGEFRRAAQLLYQNHFRFQQEKGWFAVTKNLFHPSLKHRYATWSGLTNYNGYTLACLSESIAARKSKITEEATPAEIGGYVATLDEEFANTFVNAGGMQAQICTRGEFDGYGGVQWHTLGITRFSRAGWDSRLGPGAGYTSLDLKEAISFCPVFLENGQWTRVCQQPKRFIGSFKPEFVHPLLVRGVYTIEPQKGQTRPKFEMNLTLTPDGALVDTVCTEGAEQFGVVWPLLAFDGRSVLSTSVGKSIATTEYPPTAGKAAVLQAEDARLSGAAKTATDQTDFRGSGFVTFGEDGGAVEWSGIEGGDGGTTAIGFRYSRGEKAPVAANLTVNGVAQPDATFLSTGAWSDWHQLYVPVKLARGTDNVIRLEFAGAGAANIDELRVHPAIASAAEKDQQNFIALKDTHQLDATDAVAQGGGYGDLQPVRVTDSGGGRVETFVYPRSAGDPTGDKVRASFVRDGRDFSSVLGRVKGNLYVGRTSAGGEGNAIDLDNDGKDDVTFDQSCAFILQLKDGRVTAVETDRAVKASVSGGEIELAAFTPVAVGGR